MLAIAGSDSGGGAGIQADLKAFARCGVYGMTAITAITAQSTTGVDAIQAVDPDIVLAQVRAVCGDIGVDAVKVGMLGTAAVTRAVARALRELPGETPIVVDPVMVAESGAHLLDADARRALVQEILPLASVATPNIPEARALTQGSADALAGADTAGGGSGSDALADLDGPLTAAAAQQLARVFLALGPRAVVLTGGHRAGRRELIRNGEDRRDADDGALSIDLFVAGPGADGGEGACVELPGVRYAGGAAHGSGCTHSSVLAAQLAVGRTPLQAARIARRLAGEAVARGLRDIGAGAGPVDVLGLERLRDGIIERR